MRHCGSCNTDKDESEFYKRKDRTSGLQNSCKECMKACRYRCRADPEKRRREYELKKLRYKLNPEKRSKYLRKYRLRKFFNLSVQEYDSLLAKQNGVCAICKKEELNTRRCLTGHKKQELSVDHCHKTGAVRGLLCSRCNPAIGLLDENPELFLSAINYLAAV